MPIHRHPITAPKGSDTLAGVPLDRGLIARLRTSYGQVRENGLGLAEIFYAKLFAAAPHLRSMFRTEPAVQAEKLIASLDAIVRNLEAPEANAEMLAALGRRHVGYGAKPEHYELVIEMLVGSMQELLGSRADQRSLDEWRMALRLVSNQMIEAARAAEGASHAGRGGAVQP